MEDTEPDSQGWTVVAEKISASSLSNTVGRVWRKTGNTCPVWYACGPLKWKETPISLVPTKCSISSTNTDQPYSGTAPTAVYYPVLFYWAYDFFDSNRKILEAFSKWEYRICFTSSWSHPKVPVEFILLIQLKAKVLSPPTQRKANPTPAAECPDWEKTRPP